MVNAFISYQRADSFFAAHAIGYAVRAAKHEAFVDTGSIARGALYPQAIREAISKSNVMLAVIGPSFNFERLSEPSNVISFEWRRAQFNGVAVVPVLVDGGQMPRDPDLPASLRWFTKRNAYTLRKESFSGDTSALIDSIPSLCSIPRSSSRVLWVDDNPSNNEYERKKLRPHGIVFDNVVSTNEALDQLMYESYDLVITDLNRANSSDRSYAAGNTFLGNEIFTSGGPPVIVYAGMSVISQEEKLLDEGALVVTANRQKLIDSVLEILGRLPDHISGLAE